MKFPKIDLKEIEEEQKRNIKERREFIKLYVEWLKRTPNKVWSKQQAEFINSSIRVP